MEAQPLLIDPLASLPQPAHHLVPRGKLRSEPALRTAISTWLQGQGIALASKKLCAAGEPDLLTSDHSVILEVKHQLHRKALYQALGQVLLYRQSINPAARAVIIGYGTEDTPTLAPLIERLGVEVRCWDDRDLVPAAQSEPVTAPQPVEPMHEAEDEAHHAVNDAREDEEEAIHDAPHGSRTLRWRVAELAQAQGIPNASQLAARFGLDRQSVYGPWKGETRQIGLPLLGQLAHALGAEPGDWFVWEPAEEGQPPQLRWNIAALAEARGFNLGQLYFEAQVHQTSLRPIWFGKQKSVTTAILARLAHALNLPDQPFSVGGLFAWERETSGQ